MSTSRNQAKFTPGFKAEAVAMVKAAGDSIAQLAKELGIHDSSLGNWVRQARQDAAGAPDRSRLAMVHAHRVLRVSGSRFYNWQSRPSSERDVTDRLLAAEMEATGISARTYGTLRVHAWLRREGFRAAQAGREDHARARLGRWDGPHATWSL